MRVLMPPPRAPAPRATPVVLAAALCAPGLVAWLMAALAALGGWRWGAALLEQAPVVVQALVLLAAPLSGALVAGCTYVRGVRSGIRDRRLLGLTAAGALLAGVSVAAALLRAS